MQLGQRDASGGLGLFFEQEVKGLWPLKENPERLTPSELERRIKEVWASHREERKQGHFRLPNRKDRPTLLRQLRGEVKDGWLEAELSISELDARFGDYCCLLFFGVAQGEKIRGCIDPSEVSTLSTLLETTYMSGVGGVISVLQGLHRVWGSCSLRFVKED